MLTIQAVSEQIKTYDWGGLRNKIVAGLAVSAAAFAAYYAYSLQTQQPAEPVQSQPISTVMSNPEKTPIEAQADKGPKEDTKKQSQEQTKK
eukprot:TRINITY_DN6683_c0_g2_i1.p2 TRINITY_DN6683_c0_g2~~TRINITY_DN6683_c0_g2_i1.p2  ORF type:complete len:100 (-),score=17.12 TRINITY_DN6683_c0_g2_i1:503-775(-)